MKRSVLISGFLIALMISGCSQTVAPAPQAQSDDAARRDRERDKDRERERDQNRPPDEHRDADRDHRQVSCPDGQHLYTDPDGRVRCVNN